MRLAAGVTAHHLKNGGWGSQVVSALHAQSGVATAGHLHVILKMADDAVRWEVLYTSIQVAAAGHLHVILKLAEREGFEPSVPVTQYARLAIWCLRPLGHLSARKSKANCAIGSNAPQGRSILREAGTWESVW